MLTAGPNYPHTCAPQESALGWSQKKTAELFLHRVQARGGIPKLNAKKEWGVREPR